MALPWTGDVAIPCDIAMGLWGMLDKFKPVHVLDAGSGFSSVVCRTWQKENSICKQVVSLDTDVKYLDLIREYLKSINLSHDNCFLFNEFLGHNNKSRFDFIFLDMDMTRIRVKIAPLFANMLAKNGIMLMDDWHLDKYWPSMKLRMEGLGFTIHKLPELSRLAYAERKI